MGENRYKEVFAELGRRYRQLRHRRKMVQEDVLDYGFSVRHFQQLEAGRPHSLTTLFRLAEMFRVGLDDLTKGISLPKPVVISDAARRTLKAVRAKRRQRSR